MHDITSCRRAMAQGGAIRAQGIERLVVLASEGGPSGEQAAGELLDAFATEDEASSDPDLAKALATLEMLDVARSLRDLVTGDVDQRWRALSHIDGSRHPRALAALLEAASHPVARIRRQAVKSLGTTIDATPRLLDFVASDDFLERQHAVAALQGLLVDEDDHRWHWGRRGSDAAESIRAVLVTRCNALMDAKDTEKLVELASLVALWSDPEVRAIARGCCALHLSLDPMIGLLLSSGDKEDLDAVHQLIVSDAVGSRWGVLRAVMAHTASDARCEQSLARLAELCGHAHPAHHAYMVWIATHGGLANALELIERAMDLPAEMLTDQAIQRLFEALIAIGPAAVALLPRAEALADTTDEPMVLVAAAAAAFALTGDKKHLAHVDAQAAGSLEALGAVLSKTDELGIEPVRRLQGYAVQALQHHDEHPAKEVLFELLEQRARDHLGWSPALSACHAVVHDGAMVREVLDDVSESISRDVGDYLRVLRAERREVDVLESLSQVFSNPVPAMRMRAVRGFALFGADDPLIELVLKGRGEDTDHCVQRLAAGVLQDRP